MNEMKHTPLPWRVGYRALDIGCENVKLGGYAKLFDVRGWGYLTGHGHGGLGLSQDEAVSTQEAMAEFAVRACNGYSDMLDALRLMDAYLYATAKGSNEHEIVRAAIAKAEGRT